jgi:serine carboxypeptidase-like clade 2
MVYLRVNVNLCAYLCFRLKGHITFNVTHGRNMFFWLTESQNSPKTDPLILWLNGGPGCSSLGGLLSELGPFYPDTTGTTLKLNEFSWNTIANVIFLESPSGVGFSTSNNPLDYITGDYQTAQDSVDFLLQFIQIFPQYVGRPLW